MGGLRVSIKSVWEEENWLYCNWTTAYKKIEFILQNLSWDIGYIFYMSQQ